MPIARADLAVAALLVAAGTTAAAADLGTLFHTPEERTRLDRLRRGDAEPVTAAVPRPVRPAITGFVKRSDGRHTIWVDGAPVSVTNPEAARTLDNLPDRKAGADAIRVERRAGASSELPEKPKAP